MNSGMDLDFDRSQSQFSRSSEEVRLERQLEEQRQQIREMMDMFRKHQDEVFRKQEEMSRRHQQKMAMEEEAKLKLQMQLSSLQQEIQDMQWRHKQEMDRELLSLRHHVDLKTEEIHEDTRRREQLLRIQSQVQAHEEQRLRRLMDTSDHAISTSHPTADGGLQQEIDRLSSVLDQTRKDHQEELDMLQDALQEGMNFDFGDHRTALIPNPSPEQSAASGHRSSPLSDTVKPPISPVWHTSSSSQHQDESMESSIPSSQHQDESMESSTPPREQVDDIEPSVLTGAANSPGMGDESRLYLRDMLQALSHPTRVSSSRFVEKCAQLSDGVYRP